MKSGALAIAPLFALALAFVASAEEQGAAQGTADAAVPAAHEAPPAATPQGDAAAQASAPAASARSHRIALGPTGRDEQGREGRIHDVTRGDTLWDISEAYLGTPWVWPSLWRDNRTVTDNPHRIHPGQKLWISPWEMRPVSDSEAEKLMAAAGSSPPAALAETDASAVPTRSVRFSAIEATGFLSGEEVLGLAGVISVPEERSMFVDEDLVHVGAGQSELKLGDELTFFRAHDAVLDPDTGKRIGSFVNVLGWGVVSELTPDTARVRIRTAHAEIEKGDRVVRRELRSAQIGVRPTPGGVEGRVTHFPDSRTWMGRQDVVYLDRGRTTGLMVGNEVEIYRAGETVRNDEHPDGVTVADDVVGTILIVSVQDQSSVGLVMRSSSELARGDRFRTPQAH